jgi:hypothetical protein
MTFAQRRLSIRGACMLGGALAVAVAILLLLAGAALADDVTPPQVLDFSIAPSHFDTQSAAQTISVTVTISDSQSGVASVNWGLSMPGSAQPGRAAPLVRITGDPFNGTYVGSIVMPKGSQTGVWLANLGMTDVAGNGVILYTADLEPLFGLGSASVTNDAATSDIEAPEATAFSLSASRVDTDDADQTVSLTVTLRDDFSGIDQVMAHTFPLSTGQPQMTFYLHRISGDDLCAVYSGAATLPKGSRGGAWGVLLWATDHATNTLSLYPDALAALFGTANTQIVNDAVLSDEDPPTVVAYSMTPTEFDTSAEPQTLKVDMTIADQTGIEDVAVSMQPMIAAQRVELWLRRVSGDDRLAVYEGTVTVPRYAKEGVWQPTLYVEDVLGNWRYLATSMLAELVPDAPGLFVVNTASANEVTIDRDWTLRTGQNSVTFPAGTVVTRRGGGSFAFYRMTAATCTIDDSVPTTDLDGQPVAALMLGIPGLDLTFSRPVSVSLFVGTQYNGYRMSVQSLLEGGDAWSDESTVTVAGGYVSFTVSHATRFAATPLARVRGLLPRVARRGALVTITGRDFGAQRGKVRFGATTAKRCLSWSIRRIVCRVPAKARLGKLQVRILTDAGASNAVSLRVTR